jgi:hypothetical protein
MGTNTGENSPFGTLFELHKGVCSVGTDSGSGTGFLCKFSVEGRKDKVYGLLTNSYTLDVRDLANPFTMHFDIFRGGKKTSYEKKINPSDHFRFSCAVLDATFMNLHDEEVQSLEADGRLFLELDTSWEGKRGEEVLIVQEQTGMKARFTNGGFIRNHGVYLLHTSKAEIGSWGSPLALKDGRVIGLHKRRATKKVEPIDVAVSSKAIVDALSNHCKQPTLPRKLISNPIRFDERSESRILEHDLAKCADKDNRLLIYVTLDREVDKERHSIDGTVEDGNEHQETTTVNPVWFVPTNHGWYWTPTDPFDRTQETNWMSVNTRLVVGGRDQNRKRMCKEDWVIAGWLARTGNIQNRKVQDS